MERVVRKGASPLARLAVVAAVALYALLVLRTSWVSDDAFITLRVVDNAVHGYGPRWNVDERVQAFTHPLWFVALAIPYAVVREPYLTASVLCWLASFAAVGLLARRLGRRDPWIAALAVLGLSLSRAFVDYSTSGLENPLTHLLLVAFAIAALDGERTEERRALILCVLAGLVVTNRMDALLFVAPTLAVSLWPLRWSRAIRIKAIGFAPFVLWELFALVYYGSPWPNTALAKLNTGIPAGELFAQGVRYVQDALVNDPITVLLIAAGLAAAALRRRPREMALAAGLLLYLMYVLKIGGDFMAGRFLAAPALVGAILVAAAAVDLGPRARLAAAFAVVAAGAVGAPALFASGQSYASRAMQLLRPHGIADERRFYFATAGLFNGTPGWTRPTRSNRSVNKGLDFARTKTRVAVEGAVGYVGFFAGPSVHIVDYHALGDPLLSRLPMVARDPFYASFLRKVRPAETADPWRIGHFLRAIPAGYLATVATGESRIADPAVAALWSRVARVTRGPILASSRWGDVVALAFGGRAIAERTTYTHIPWDELIAADPGNAEARFEKALDLLDDKDEAGAIALFEETLRIAPDMERAMTRLAEYLIPRGDLDRAADLIARARALAPEDPAAVGVAGDLARARGRDDEAATLYLESARLDPVTAARMYGNVGILKALRGDFASALDWFGRADALSPGDPQIAYNIGSAYARMGRREEAKAAFRRSLELDPGFEPARRALTIYERGGP